MKRVAAALALALGVAAGLGACGIPEEQKPHAISDRDVPFSLLQPAPPETVAKP